MTRDELLEIIFATDTAPAEARRAFDGLSPVQQLQIIWEAGYGRGFDDGALTCRYSGEGGDPC